MRQVTWSQYVQKSNDIAVAFLNESVLEGSKVVVEGGQVGTYIHVDDGIMLVDGKSQTTSADAMMHRAADELEGLGFTVGDRTEDGKVKKVIGFEPCRKPARFQLPAEKLGLLWHVFSYMLSQPFVETERL